MSYDDFILSNYPRKVTVARIKTLLGKEDSFSKNELIDFVYHRLNRRYVVPLLHVPKKYKSGFLTMASACFMIETIEAFYNGKKETDRGAGRATFKAFFERESDLFPGLAADAKNFYRNIRCGILHQAETRGGYRIMRTGPLFDTKTKKINANSFLRALAKSLRRYVAALRRSENDSALWKNAKKKISFISDNCQT